MADRIRFVDAISNSPTTLLDLNDLNPWAIKTVTAPPPRLRRAMSSNAMSDGFYVSSSQYDARTVSLSFELRTSTQDTNATALQALARRLDQASGFLEYRPTGASKSVFFRVWRSDFSSLLDVNAASAYRKGDVELLCDPFAYGVRETVASAVSVPADPAAASGLYFDVAPISGDVSAPLVISFGTTLPTLLASFSHATPSLWTHYIQAEDASGPITLGTDTTRAGANDANYSGAAAPNYTTTSFATDASLATRLTWSLGSSVLTSAQRMAQQGPMRVLARVSATGAGTFKARAVVGGVSGTKVSYDGASGLLVLDLGVFNPAPVMPGLLDDGGTLPSKPADIAFQFSRTSGASSLKVDYLEVLPASQSYANLTASVNYTVDGERSRAYTSSLYALVPSTGGFPMASPSKTTRIYLQKQSSILSDSTTVTATYLPRYLFVRPSTS